MQARAMAATTQAPLLRMPKATSQALMPTGSPATSRAGTLAVTHPTLAQATTRAMAAAVATLAGVQPATSQGLRPTGNHVLSMARTPTATAQAIKDMAATPVRVRLGMKLAQFDDSIFQCFIPIMSAVAPLCLIGCCVVSAEACCVIAWQQAVCFLSMPENPFVSAFTAAQSHRV